MQSKQSPTLNPALRSFWLAHARYRILYGGRSSSKSWDAAGFAIFLAQKIRVRFLCTRQFQNKIEESVYTLLKIQIERFGLTEQFTILNNKIIHNVTGSEFIFYGLWRHIDEIKSLEGVDICWIEEAHNLTKKQWEILEPTIRKNGSQFWVIFNPRLSSDFTYRRFVVNPPPNSVVRKINYTENPFLSETMLSVIEAAKAEDYEDYEHIYLGVPRENDDSVVIKRSWIMAAIDAHRSLGFSAAGRKRIGFDVADSGKDLCANVYAHGSIVSWAAEWKGREDELLESCSRTYSKARELDAEIIYDSIGVGATAGSKFKELNAEHRIRIKYHKFNAGDSVSSPESNYQPGVKNKDFFSNLKAQTWWTVADRFRNTYNAVHKGEKFSDDELISIDADCPYLDKLIDELATPKRDFDKNGRVKVESKEDLAKRDVPSPNIADGFVMCFVPQQQGFFSTKRH